jgi:histidine triad (HIT) family protein
VSDTIFDKIIRRELPADIVYEDDEILAFRDIHPQAPVHVLFVPKRKSIPTLNDCSEADAGLLGKLLLAASAYAKREGFADDGYRCRCRRGWPDASRFIVLDGGHANRRSCKPGRPHLRASWLVAHQPFLGGGGGGRGTTITRGGGYQGP